MTRNPAPASAGTYLVAPQTPGVREAVEQYHRLAFARHLDLDPHTVDVDAHRISSLSPPMWRVIPHNSARSTAHSTLPAVDYQHLLEEAELGQHPAPRLLQVSH